jgi:hypothetical protein
MEDHTSLIGHSGKLSPKLELITGLPLRDSAIDEVSEALSMHVAPLAIRIVVVPTGVTVLLGLRNPSCSWTGMVGPSLPGFTIAPYVDSLLCYRLIR